MLIPREGCLSSTQGCSGTSLSLSLLPLPGHPEPLFFHGLLAHREVGFDPGSLMPQYSHPDCPLPVLEEETVADVKDNDINIHFCGLSF